MTASVVVLRPSGRWLAFPVPPDDPDLTRRLITDAATAIPNDAVWVCLPGVIPRQIATQEVHAHVHDARPEPARV